MSETAARPVVDQLFEAGRTQAMAQMVWHPLVPTSRLGASSPDRADAASFAVVAAAAVAAVAATVYVALTILQAWLTGPLGTDVGVVIGSLLCGLAASSAMWRGDEGRAAQPQHADLQFARRCVRDTQARLRSAASTVPLAAALVGPVDRAYDEVRTVCLTLRLDRDKAVRDVAPLGAEADWERTILLAQLEVLTAAVIAANEAVAMVASVSLAPVTVEAPGHPRDDSFAAIEILEVLAAALDG